jgi:ribosome-binding protein aMBF1 (putative translation factor)
MRTSICYISIHVNWPYLLLMATRAGLAEKKRFLSLVRQLRIDAGLRQADLARRLGEPQSFVSRYESGERRLDVLELRQICSVLGVSLGDFVKRLGGEAR